MVQSLITLNCVNLERNLSLMSSKKDYCILVGTNATKLWFVWIAVTFDCLIAFVAVYLWMYILRNIHVEIVLTSNYLSNN